MLEFRRSCFIDIPCCPGPPFGILLTVVQCLPDHGFDPFDSRLSSTVRLRFIACSLREDDASFPAPACEVACKFMALISMNVVDCIAIHAKPEHHFLAAFVTTLGVPGGMCKLHHLVVLLALIL